MKLALTNIVRSMSRAVLLSLAVSTLASGFNSNMRIAASMQADGVHNSKEAIYEVNERKIAITLDSAKELQRVFSSQLHKQKHEFKHYSFLEPAEPRIDSKGIIHLGVWSLTTEGEELVLSHRAPTVAEAKVFYRLLAKAKRSSNGAWSVEPIAVERVFR